MRRSLPCFVRQRADHRLPSTMPRCGFLLSSPSIGVWQVFLCYRPSGPVAHPSLRDSRRYFFLPSASIQRSRSNIAPCASFTRAIGLTPSPSVSVGTLSVALHALISWSVSCSVQQLRMCSARAPCLFLHVLTVIEECPGLVALGRRKPLAEPHGSGACCDSSYDEKGGWRR